MTALFALVLRSVIVAELDRFKPTGVMIVTLPVRAGIAPEEDATKRNRHVAPEAPAALVEHDAPAPVTAVAGGLPLVRNGATVGRVSEVVTMVMPPVQAALVAVEDGTVSVTWLPPAMFLGTVTVIQRPSGPREGPRTAGSPELPVVTSVTVGLLPNTVPGGPINSICPWPATRPPVGDVRNENVYVVPPP